MSRLIHTVIIVAMTASLGSVQIAGAAGVSRCTGAGVTHSRFVLKYEQGAWQTTAPAQTRITDRDRVEVCVEHFNFLRYTLKFDIAEQQVQGYSYLAKLWESILSPSLAAVLAAPGGPAPDLTQRLQTVYRLSRDLDAKVAATARQYTATGLTDAEAMALFAARGDESVTPKTGIAGELDVLGRAWKDVQDFILRDSAAFVSVYSDRQEMYRDVSELYDAVNQRTTLFLRLSAKAAAVQIKSVGKRKAGTRVTFTVAAADESGSLTPVDEVSYFVQTNIPLVAHGGIAFAGLNDVTFNTVRRATTFGEEDLFQQASNESNTTAYTLFLGWQFFGATRDVTADARQARIGGAFSIGTDLQEPGKRVFVAPSLLLFNRIVVSGGLVLGKEAEGQNATLEPNVFRIVREQLKTSWFFSLSTKVY